MLRINFIIKKLIYIIQSLNDIVGLFSSQYVIKPAHTLKLTREAFELRHKVYCEEFEFESANFKKIEIDSYDERSTQLVMHYRPLNQLIGCMRFIHGHWNGIAASMPFEKHCKASLNHEAINLIKNSSYKYAEISRLTIDKNFRHGGASRGIKKNAIRSSCALVALLSNITAFARIHNTRYLFCMVDVRLLHYLQRIPVAFKIIGEKVEFRGTRYPIVLDRFEIEKNMPFVLRVLCNRNANYMRKFIALQECLIQVALPSARPEIYCDASPTKKRLFFGQKAIHAQHR